jgi:hypothetical protein
VLEAPLRIVGVLASAVVVLSFVLLAIDEAGDASRRTAAAVAGLQATRTADPSPREERAREAAHGELRETIDDVNDVLIAPFAAIVGDGGSAWVRRGVPALLALLVYGVGLALVARLVRFGG